MKIKQKFLISFVALLCLFMGISDIHAASLSAKANKSSVKVGETFSVTISSSGYMVEGLRVSCSGCTLVSGISRLTLDSGESQTIQAKLTSSQGATVTFTGQGVDYNKDDVEINVSASAYVSAKKSTTKPSTTPQPSTQQATNARPKPAQEPKEDPRSKDNDLSSLEIDQGELKPKFDKNQTSYKVDLPADATSINISAKAHDAKAKVNGLGKKNLSAGKNTIKIEVVSEYGTKKVFTIDVYVDEKPLIFTTFHDEKLGVVRNMNGIQIPSNFKKTTTKLEGKTIPAWTNDKMKKTIVCLSDEKNNKSFYLIEDEKIYSKFEVKKLVDREVYCIDISKDQQLEGFTYGPIKIDGVEFMGWTYKNPKFKDYQIVMVMDKDGEIRYYQHEKSENTLQLYTKTAPVTQDEWNSLQHEVSALKHSKNTWMIVSITLLVFGAGGLIFMKYKKKE